jgi:ribonucleoside-diphosphate reductase alpha chain
LWDNRNNFNGAAILPHDGGSYTQAPFEDITEDQYNTLVEELLKEPIDFTKITENEDNTSFTQELACAGGNC